MMLSNSRQGGFPALIHVCVFFLAIFSGYLLAAEIPYENDFEITDGVVEGGVSEIPDLALSGSVSTSVSFDAASGLQSLQLDYSGSISLDLSSGMLPPMVGWYDFYVKPVVVAEEELPDSIAPYQASVTGFVDLSGQGWIFVIDGDGMGSGQWLPVGAGFTLSGRIADSWMRLTYRLDYIGKMWDLYVDGEFVATDLGFLDDTVDSLNHFKVSSDETDSTRIDFLYAGIANPLFEDTSNDGLPDTWLSDQGLNVFENQRRDDSDFDGLSALDEFKLQTRADQADSDSDGIPDGPEVFAGDDPTSSDDYLLEPLPFFADFEMFSPGGFLSQGSWVVSGNAAIQADELYAGSYSLELSEGAQVSLYLDGNTSPVMWSDFYAIPTVHESLDSSIAAQPTDVIFLENGEIWAISGFNLDWNQLEIAQADTWRRITRRIDYVSRSYDIYVDGERLAEGLEFSGAEPFLYQLVLDSGRWTHIDNITVSPQEPVALDNDRDGWENERELLVESTDPEKFDTDEDGMADSLEPLWGLDPLSGDSFLAKLEESFPSTEVFEWKTSFGVAEGYFDGAVDAQENWTAYGDAAIDSEVLILTESETLDASVERLLGVGANRKLWLSFRAKLSTGVLPDLTDSAETAVAVWGATGVNQIAIWNDTTQTWQSFSTPNPTVEWNSYEVYLDYIEQKWLLAQNGILIAEGLPFVDPDLVALSRFKVLLQQADEPIVGDPKRVSFDDVLVSTMVPAHLDYDGDGLLNTQEIDVGSDILRSDSDGDGMLDLWEYTHGLDLLSDDSELDLDNDGIVNLVEFESGSLPLSSDSDGDGFTDLEEAIAGTSGTDSNEYPDSKSLPDSWRVAKIGKVDWALGLQHNNLWRIASEGKDGDDCGFFYREFENGYSVTFRIHDIALDAKSARVGVMIRDRLGNGSPLLAGYTLSDGSKTRVEEREQDGVSLFNGKLSSGNYPTPDLYFRLSHTSENSKVEVSPDGTVWRNITESYIERPINTFAGVYVTSGKVGSLELNKASIELIDVKLDSDFDGLWDFEEINLGTDPYKSDTDDDGITDFAEVNSLNTDPLIADNHSWDGSMAIDILSADELLGNWSKNSLGELSCNDIAGKVGLSLGIPESGIYQLEIPVRYAYINPDNSARPLVIHHYIDGEFLETSDYLSDDEEDVEVLKISLPYLKSGQHTYTLHWENVYEMRTISLGDIVLSRLDGLSDNEQETWRENYISRTESIESSTIESRVSPAFIEGKTKFLSMMSLSVCG
ncbi:MAG: hypothetical protein ACPGN3_05885 [Opitutales bacterium]